MPSATLDAELNRLCERRARVAAAVFRCPVALVSFVDENGARRAEGLGVEFGPVAEAFSVRTHLADEVIRHQRR